MFFLVVQVCLAVNPAVPDGPIAMKDCHKIALPFSRPDDKVPTQQQCFKEGMPELAKWWMEYIKDPNHEGQVIAKFFCAKAVDGNEPDKMQAY